MLFKFLFYAFLLTVFSTQPTYAYIDPGTGSFVTQVIAASIIGVLVSIKAFWMNIKLFFLNIFNKNSQNSAEELEENEQN